MAMKFTDALDKKPDDVVAPPILPVGTYIFMVTKAHTVRETEAWDFVTLPVKVLSAEDDVDEDDLAEFGKVLDTPSRVQFMFPTDPEEETSYKRSEFQLKKFLESHLQVEGDTMGEMLANAVNAQFLGTIKHVPDKRDPSVVYAEIRGTAPLMD